ncbi:hypothetical protein O6H91_17G012000 [Diphasiastrum complanatum]|uniref:Uncharacterized protein n=1 Tax=Diphasiastrum complanatum TaxID=34168 RepID=A0ACC2B4C7_DIPCM|nr:hypothetical protein O6H91_17G012000 [Diphasiastrum complanatum]
MVQKMQSEHEAYTAQMEELMAQNRNLIRELQETRLKASNDGKLIDDVRQSLGRATIERDAAIVAKEDLLAQLRLAKKRLHEAEEEQYKAEEDAAALRAELKMLQHIEQPSDSLLQSSSDSWKLEQEATATKAALEDALQQLEKEQQKFSTERQKVLKLTEEKEELEIALQTARKNASAEKRDSGANQLKTEVHPSSVALSKVEKKKYDQQLRELASMIERLENGRQKLLAEIDAQSLEIERLFMENAGLIAGLKDTSQVASEWEKQVQECIKQNSCLTTTLNRMRMEQALVSGTPFLDDKGNFTSAVKDGDSVQQESAGALELEALKVERSHLKVELAKALARSEELSGQVSQLSLDLTRAVYTSNNLNRLYHPILSTIESRLLQLKQDPAHNGGIF